MTLEGAASRKGRPSSDWQPLVIRIARLLRAGTGALQ